MCAHGSTVTSSAHLKSSLCVWEVIYAARCKYFLLADNLTLHLAYSLPRKYLIFNFFGVKHTNLFALTPRLRIVATEPFPIPKPYRDSLASCV